MADSLVVVGIEDGPAEGVARTLDTFRPGESGTIVTVDSSSPLGRRLLDVGITPGCQVRVVRRAPLGDPIEVSLPDVHLSLRAYEASLVSVSFNY